MIQPNVAAEAGVGRDEANRISTRVYGKLSKPCQLKQLDEYVLYTTKYLINTEEEKRREEKRSKPGGAP